MKYLSIILLLTTFFCEAKEINQHKKEQIKELLDIAYMSDIIPPTVSNQIQRQNKQADESEVIEKVKQRMDVAFYEPEIQIFDHMMSEADLETALTYFKSESNKKFKLASAATFSSLFTQQLPNLIAEVLEPYPTAQPKTEEGHEDLPQGKFNEEVLESKLPVVVVFYGDHCPPCKRLAPILVEIAEQMQGYIKFVKMKLSNHPQVASDLNINVVPTILFYKEGKLLEKHLGFINKEALREKIAKNFATEP